MRRRSPQSEVANRAAACGATAQTCGASATIGYTVSFAGLPGSVRSSKPVRLELLATYDGHPTGCAVDVDCSGAVSGCFEDGSTKTILVRFGFPVP